MPYKNPEDHRKNQQERRRTHPGEAASIAKKWRERHPERVKEVDRKKNADPTRRAAGLKRLQDWQKKNPDKVKKNRAAWYEKNPDYAKNWREKNQDRCLATRLRVYGVTLEQYKTKVEKQHGLCGICGRKPKGRLVVDHDHKTNKFRGLLCHQCNQGLGLFQDSVDVLLNASSYLKHVQ